MNWNPRDVPIERPASFDPTGKRVFLHPAKVQGYFKNLRNVFYFFLLFVFLVLPWTEFGAEQTILLDISQRRFVFFGQVFSAHDGPLIFFPLILASLGLGFVTSIWGRVWCGWACPQTVFLESIFRRIDHWIEGNHQQRLKLERKPWNFEKGRKKVLKWALFAVICSHMAHSFTAYFVGAKTLFWFTTVSPLVHWPLFVFVQVLTLILLFNFGWFREQFCIIMCPYGRFQSVLMGVNSLAVLYDEKRGEPRKRPKLKEHGDCVDCYRCVSVCPMGIDIRRGMQMECIACTACIDACDEVMEKVRRPKGLIRYASLQELETGGRKLFGRRSLVYLGFLLVLLASFVLILRQRVVIDLKVLRAIEAPYSVVDGTLVNHFRLVVKNQGARDQMIQVPRSSRGELVAPQFPLSLAPGEQKRVHFFVKIPLDQLGKGPSQIIQVEFDVVSEVGEERESLREEVTILKPSG